MIKDFALVTAVVSDHQIDLHFPYDPELVAMMKEMKGRWDPNRKCWYLTRAGEAQDQLRSLSERLLEKAPDKWRGRLETIRNLCCVTSRYELFVAEGGIRLSVPPTHPVEYALKKTEGVKEYRNLFYIPAVIATDEKILEIIKRLLKEDRELYADWMEPSVGRGLSGLLVKETFRLETIDKEKKLLFASRAFLKSVDPAFGNAPLPTVPFSISSLKVEDQDSIRVSLRYPDLEHGYNALVRYRTEENPRPLLTDKDVLGKWRIHSRM